MATAGKALRIRVSTTAGGVYNLVADLNDASMTVDGDNQDVSAFGDTFIKRIQGLKDTSFSLGGFWLPTDTLGQVIIRDALINDTALFIQFLPDGTTGFRVEVKVASFEISSSVDGVNELSIDLEGISAITNV